VTRPSQNDNASLALPCLASGSPRLSLLLLNYHHGNGSASRSCGEMESFGQDRYLYQPAAPYRLPMCTTRVSLPPSAHQLCRAFCREGAREQERTRRTKRREIRKMTSIRSASARDAPSGTERWRYIQYGTRNSLPVCRPTSLVKSRQVKSTSVSQEFKDIDQGRFPTFCPEPAPLLPRQVARSAYQQPWKLQRKHTAAFHTYYLLG
jgi:hypothetical protein